MANMQTPIVQTGVSILQEQMASKASGPVLEVVNLSAYYGKSIAVSRISMRFNRRTITALIGPSGCG